VTVGAYYESTFLNILTSAGVSKCEAGILRSCFDWLRFSAVYCRLQELILVCGGSSLGVSVRRGAFAQQGNEICKAGIEHL